jgi:predicted MPP superfamily phosphohydrolase
MTLAGCGWFRVFMCAALLICAAGFPAGRALAHKIPDVAAGVLTTMGYLYLSPMIYGFMISVVVDLLRLLNNVIAITHNPPPFPLGTRVAVVLGIIGASLAISGLGSLNASRPAVRASELTIPVRDESLAGHTLKIALMSDIHLGAFTGAGFVKKLAALTNAQSPDIVILLGDTVDDAAFFRDGKKCEEAAEALSEFSSRFGTWAITGNHDYYAGMADFEEFLQRTNVTLLKDEAVIEGGEFILAGRIDRAAERDGAERKKIVEILSSSLSSADLSAGLPLIVLDHQPFGLQDAEAVGAALQLSGHTHRGQLWPFNFVVYCMYEKYYGFYKKGGANYYITGGVGTWGPPVRTSGRPEIMILTLNYVYENAAKNDDEE